MNINKLNETNIKGILRLQDKVLNSQPDNKDLKIYTEEFITKKIKDDNYLFMGVLKGLELISYSLIVLNTNDCKNYFEELKVYDGLKNANFDMILVDPDYKGMGFQDMLMKEIDKELKKEKFKEVFCVISNENTKALNNFYRNDYQTLGTIEKTIEKPKILLKKEYN